MKETVSVAPAAVVDEAVLPSRVQEALGELVGAAKEGLLALSVGVGLGVLAELMEEEVDDVVGPEGQAQPRPRRGSSWPRGWRGHARRARRVGVERPRVRTADGSADVGLVLLALR